MKRIVFFLALVLISLTSNSQAISNRSSAVITVQDARLFAQYNFRPPVYYDTTEANNQLGLDSAGALIFTRDSSVYWLRTTSPKRWVSVGNKSTGAGSGTVTSISQGYGISNSPNPITSIGTIKVDTTTLSNKYVRIADTANRWVNKITRTPGVDSIYYYIGNTKYSIKDSSGGGGTVTRAVDTIYRTLGKDSIYFTIAGITYKIKDSTGGGGTVTRAVDTLYRTPGKDSIYFKIAGITYKIKDSTGGGGSALAIKNYGATVTSAATSINFLGGGVTTSASGTDVTVNIPGGGSGSATFSQNIIMNGTSSNRLGNYVNGDTIPVAGLGLDSALKIISQKVVHPTYTPPTATISSTPTEGNYETGTMLSITFSRTFNKNDAGAATGTTYYKNNVAFSGNSSGLQLLSPTTYKAIVSYAQGDCKVNNLGDTDCVGRIPAGSVQTTNTLTFTPLFKNYWGYTTASAPNSSQVVASLGGGNELASSKVKDNFAITVSGTGKYVYFAYPVSYGLLNSINISGLESINAFTWTAVYVMNAQSYSELYYVYTSQNQFNNTTVTFNSVN